MKVLIKSAKLIDVSNEYHNQTIDILIESGIISKIGKDLKIVADYTVSSENLHVSKGWIDGKTNFCDPGNEHKEDLASGLKLAEEGGFTSVVLTSDTNPKVSSKSIVDSLIRKAEFSAVNVYPTGTLTQQAEGNVLAEMFDMQEAGAVAFSDAEHTVSAGIMYRALLYAKNFNGVVVSFPYDSSIFGKGQINEGKASIYTGLKSIPALSEYIVVQRDLSLLEYTHSKLHFTGISTKESIELIAAAKKKGLQVTADCYIHNLVCNETDVLDFDSNFKFLPPLRSESDKKALIEALKHGVIDFVVSDHNPEDIENKELEFDFAAFGSIGTQILFPLLNSISNLNLETKIELLTTKPATSYNLNLPEIKEGHIANLTFFDPSKTWEFNHETNLSKSNNSPFLNTTMTGKAIGIYNKGILSLTSEDRG